MLYDLFAISRRKEQISVCSSEKSNEKSGEIALIKIMHKQTAYESLTNQQRKSNYHSIRQLHKSKGNEKRHSNFYKMRYIPTWSYKTLITLHIDGYLFKADHLRFCPCGFARTDNSIQIVVNFEWWRWKLSIWRRNKTTRVLYLTLNYHSRCHRCGPSNALSVL